jgi:conjugative relaxase-like TrwC/TraI family protein
VLKFATFGSARSAVRYFVDRDADCAQVEPHVLEPGVDAAGRAVDYYGEAGRTPGIWLGSGADALGLTGPITAAQVPVLTALLSGQLPDGTPVARPVWRPHPDGRLPAAPLLDAIRATATRRGLRIDQVLPTDALRGAHAKLTGRVDRDPDAVAHPQVLLDLATATGVDATRLYGAGTMAVSVAHAETKVDGRRAGADGPLSAPKSASVLWALADHHTGAQVLAAHRTAVTETVAFLERWAGHGLRGHQGDGQRAVHIDTDGLIVAAFTHLTSRADDPQLHTHLVIANLLHGADGKWSALDTRALFRAQRTAGYLYQAVLRGELTARLGVTWGPVRKGVAEITGLPQSLLREFSTRRQAIEQRLAETGGVGVAAAQVACLDTRPKKTGRPVGQLLAGWWTRAQTHVGDPTAAIRAILGRGRSLPLAEVDADRITGWLLGPDGATRHRSSFDRGELTRDLLEALPPGTTFTHRNLDALVGAVLRDSEVLPLVPDAYGTRRYTTRDLAGTELATLRLAATATRIPRHTPATDDTRLSGEQAAVVHAIATSPRSVDVTLGPAGAGKTALLAALHRHYQGVHVPVLGACVAAVAARRLEHATAIPATSLARLLHRVRAGQPLPSGCVLVLDEAGMVGTRDYHAVLTAVTAVGGKLVTVGDRAQLTEIDAGGMFARLSRHHLAGELTDNHRQTQPWERDALLDLRHGRVDVALTAPTVSCITPTPMSSSSTGSPASM